MLLREWSNPELVRRSRWRLRAYYIGLLTMLCFIPLFLHSWVTRSRWSDAAAILCLFIGFWLASLYRRCIHCNYVPDHRTDPSVTFRCDGCGAAPYGQRQSALESEAPGWDDLVTDPEHYWTDPQLVARFKWRKRAVWLLVGLLSVVPFTFFGLAACGVANLACDPFGALPIVYLLFGMASLGIFLIPSFALRCPHCGDRFNDMSMMMGGVCCHSCGAVLSPVDSRHRRTRAIKRSRKTEPAARKGNLDPLEAADTLMSFNRAPQAIKLLEDALSRNPSRADIAARLEEIRQILRG